MFWSQGRAMLLRFLLNPLVSSVLPTWGYSVSLLSPFLGRPGWLKGCTVEHVRELTWLKTDSDKIMFREVQRGAAWKSPLLEMPSRMDVLGYSPVWRLNPLALKTYSGVFASTAIRFISLAFLLRKAWLMADGCYMLRSCSRLALGNLSLCPLQLSQCFLQWVGFTGNQSDT